MKITRLITLLMTAAVALAVSLVEAETVNAAEKPGELKIVPAVEPAKVINADGEQVVQFPSAFCDGQWQGPAAGHIPNWFVGNEYYAAYQDPTETGCVNTYPFEVKEVVWQVQSHASVTIEIQPLIYEYLGPDLIGPIVCSGPWYTVVLPSAGLWTISLPFQDTCCVNGPYYAGIYCPTNPGPGILDIVVDDGTTVSPRSNATYNDWGGGWVDLVDDVGFVWNLELWSRGYNSDQNSCQVPRDSAIVLDTVYGLAPDGKLIPGQTTKFMMRWVYSTGSRINGFTNTFRVYSPDGATWKPIVLDTLPHSWTSKFDLAFIIDESRVNGSGADTVMVGGAVMMAGGVAAPFDAQVWWIETMVYEQDIGRHLCIDSANLPGGGYWLWSVPIGSLRPNWYGQRCIEIGKCCFLRGNVDAIGIIDITDLTYLVAYMFGGGSAPPCPSEADINADANQDIADLTDLVAYMFGGGPAPVPCP